MIHESSILDVVLSSLDVVLSSLDVVLSFLDVVLTSHGTFRPFCKYLTTLS